MNVILITLLSGCLATPPEQTENLCRIFKEKPKWYWAMQRTEHRWKVPMSVVMAIMHQESRFRADAKPPRRYLLGFIPWFRPSNAYGYSQALDGTWEGYQRATGRWGADRDDFNDAADFMGWYAAQARQKARIPSNDSYALYLAYHEGIGGYLRKTYLKKDWLTGVARKVAYRAIKYHNQLKACQSYLKSKPWYRFW